MLHSAISTEDASYRKRVSILDTNIAYVDVGEGRPNRLSSRQPHSFLSVAELLSHTCYRSDDVLPLITLAWVTQAPLPMVVTGL